LDEILVGKTLKDSSPSEAVLDDLVNVEVQM